MAFRAKDRLLRGSTQNQLREEQKSEIASLSPGNFGQDFHRLHSIKKRLNGMVHWVLQMSQCHSALFDASLLGKCLMGDRSQ
jgi:hypothetical protein